MVPDLGVGLRNNTVLKIIINMKVYAVSTFHMSKGAQTFAVD